MHINNHIIKVFRASFYLDKIGSIFMNIQPEYLSRSGFVNSRLLIFVVAMQLIFCATVWSASPSLEEALDTTNIVWETAGDQLWFGITSPSHDGVDAAQSGPIDDFESSVLTTTIVGPGTVSFWWRVSSEPNADDLRFYINGDLIARISGESGWQFMSVRINPGTNELVWEYSKDFSLAYGLDAGWVDQFVFTPDVVVPQLSITRTGSNVVLSWQAQAVNFVLQKTDSLNYGHIWIDVNTSYVINNGVVSVTLPITGKEQYFRLKW